MKRVALLLPGSVLIAATVSTTFLVTILPPPGAAAQQSTGLPCSCDPYTVCNQYCNRAGPCCSPRGYCGIGGGYCGQCFCWQDPQYVICDDCNCDGTCITHNIKVATYDDDNDDRNHNVSAAAAAPTPSWHLMENISSSSSLVTSPSPSKVGPVHRYGSAAVCGQSAMDLANTVVPGQCLEVTNLENGKHAMVRVTGHKQYHCSNTSLLLERGVFQLLVGTSGGGGHGDVQARHFPIRYKYVRCIGN
ncbi:unnamed protein product [Linum trigynum]|uniref:Uncharacterized protein n=1 Tax=Linum trigynum TaxID=586398 RepID=A0AAV2GUY7_9ROSI